MAGEEGGIISIDDGDDDDLVGLHRRPDHDTSIQAAERVFAAMGLLRQRVLEAHVRHIARGGLTDAALTRYCTMLHGKRPESSYRKRRTDLSQTTELVQSVKYQNELKAVGWQEPLIIDSNARQIEAGSPCIVWIVNPIFQDRLKALFGIK